MKLVIFIATVISVPIYFDKRAEPTVIDDSKILEPGLGAKLTTKFDDLPAFGRTLKTPWASDYWPNFQDSINYRWAGTNTLSPAEKYQKAFSPNVNVPSLVSTLHGIESYRLTGRKCSDASECNVGDECAIKDSVGVCIPNWHGICQ